MIISSFKNKKMLIYLKDYKELLFRTETFGTFVRQYLFLNNREIHHGDEYHKVLDLEKSLHV